MRLEELESQWKEAKYEMEISRGRLEVLVNEGIPNAIKARFTNVPGVEILQGEDRTAGIGLAINPFIVSPYELQERLERIRDETMRPEIEAHKKAHNIVKLLENQILSKVRIKQPFYQADDFSRAYVIISGPDNVYSLKLFYETGKRIGPIRLTDKKFDMGGLKYNYAGLRGVMTKLGVYVIGHANFYVVENPVHVLSVDKIGSYVAKKLLDEYEQRHPENKMNRFLLDFRETVLEQW